MRRARCPADRPNRHRDDGGASAVEFALISVVLFLVLFGIVQYGYYFFQRQGVSNAVLDAARRSAVGEYACGDEENQLRGEVGRKLGFALDDLPSEFAVTRSYSREDSAVTSPEVGDELKVTVQVDVLDLGWLPLPDQDDADGVQLVQEAYTQVEAVTDDSDTCA